ncbi:MAG TPA: glycosyltransferase [Actinomycetota bacterium]|jgi:glycosyltransferase involved in cell wall biosynthesis
MSDAAIDWEGKRILFVGIYYWPEQTGIAPYSTAIARHLAGKGASVTCVVGMPHYPHWRVFPGYERRLHVTERVDGVTVRRCRMYVPARQTAIRRGLYEATFAASAVTARVGRRFDAVVGVIPNLGGGAAAALYAARVRAPLGLIVQDVTGAAAEQSGIAGGGGRVARITTRIEFGILRKASAIAIVSEGFRAYVEDAVASDTTVHFLPNWSQMPMATKSKLDARRELGWAETDSVVLHAGNMGLKQGLHNVIEMARLVRDTRPEIQFVLMGDGNQRPDLERSAQDLPNVRFIESRYGVDYANALAAADVLLVNERGSVKDMSLPSKLTSYFLAERPVLAAAVADGTTAREVERSGGGLVVAAEDPRAGVDALGRLLGDATLSQTLAAAGLEYARTNLTEDRGLARSEAFVDAVVSRGRASDGRSLVSPTTS